MEPPVLATASAGIFIFSLIRSWLWGRAMAVSAPIARERAGVRSVRGTGHREPDRVK
jgi:hypothetical protein